MTTRARRQRILLAASLLLAAMAFPIPGAAQRGVDLVVATVEIVPAQVQVGQEVRVRALIVERAYRPDLKRVAPPGAAIVAQVDVFAGGDRVAETKVAVLPGGRAWAEARFAPRVPGTHRVEVRVAAAQLGEANPKDNRRHGTLVVTAPAPPIAVPAVPTAPPPPVGDRPRAPEPVLPAPLPGAIAGTLTVPDDLTARYRVLVRRPGEPDVILEPIPLGPGRLAYRAEGVAPGRFRVEPQSGAGLPGEAAPQGRWTPRHEWLDLRPGERRAKLDFEFQPFEKLVPPGVADRPGIPRLPAAALCPRPDRVIYVNAATGDDRQSGGTPECALKTITHALGVARGGQTVEVARGLYDAANGERFPLVVPAGVQLTGTGHPVVRGGGSYGPVGRSTFAVVTTDGVGLTGFEVANPAGVAVLCHGRSTIRENVLTGSQYAGLSAFTGCTGTLGDNVVGHNQAFGITTWGESAPTIHRNSVARNGVGIDTAGSSLPTLDRNYVMGNLMAGVKVSDTSRPRFRWNVVRENNRGVWVQSGAASPDLGSGVGGGNTLSCNLGADLDAEVPAGRVIAARGNAWDHVPPGSDDLVLRSGSRGRVDAAEARLASAACESPEGPGFITVDFGPPDLLAAELVVDPTDVTLGEEVRARARVRNFFARIDGPVEVGLVAAPEPTLGFGPPWRPTRVATATIAGGLGDEGAEEVVEFRVATPLPGVVSESGSAAGRFMLWVEVDPDGRIAEVNEVNNRSASQRVRIAPAGEARALILPGFARVPGPRGLEPEPLPAPLTPPVAGLQPVCGPGANVDVDRETYFAGESATVTWMVACADQAWLGTGPSGSASSALGAVRGGYFLDAGSSWGPVALTGSRTYASLSPGWQQVAVSGVRGTGAAAVSVEDRARFFVVQRPTPAAGCSAGRQDEIARALRRIRPLVPSCITGNASLDRLVPAFRDGHLRRLEFGLSIEAALELMARITVECREVSDAEFDAAVGRFNEATPDRFEISWGRSATHQPNIPYVILHELAHREGFNSRLLRLTDAGGRPLYERMDVEIQAHQVLDACPVY